MGVESPVVDADGLLVAAQMCGATHHLGPKGKLDEGSGPQYWARPHVEFQNCAIVDQSS